MTCAQRQSSPTRNLGAKAHLDGSPDLGRALTPSQPLMGGRDDLAEVFFQRELFCLFDEDRDRLGRMERGAQTFDEGSVLLERRVEVS